MNIAKVRVILRRSNHIAMLNGMFLILAGLPIQRGQIIKDLGIKLLLRRQVALICQFVSHNALSLILVRAPNTQYLRFTPYWI